mmetsp:Transcript_123682/g.309107  ORF Transcript_123682/g.309107 Transcript_123682/m.309107 type:complete len:315 (+) Transcript_123682:246-1190(+)
MLLIPDRDVTGDKAEILARRILGEWHRLVRGGIGHPIENGIREDFAVTEQFAQVLGLSQRANHFFRIANPHVPGSARIADCGSSVQSTQNLLTLIYLPLPPSQPDINNPASPHDNTGGFKVQPRPALRVACLNCALLNRQEAYLSSLEGCQTSLNHGPVSVVLLWEAALISHDKWHHVDVDVLGLRESGHTNPHQSFRLPGCFDGCAVNACMLYRHRNIFAGTLQGLSQCQALELRSSTTQRYLPHTDPDESSDAPTHILQGIGRIRQGGQHQALSAPSSKHVRTRPIKPCGVRLCRPTDIVRLRGPHAFCFQT